MISALYFKLNNSQENICGVCQLNSQLSLGLNIKKIMQDQLIFLHQFLFQQVLNVYQMNKIYQNTKNSLTLLYNMLKKMHYKEMLILNYHQLIKKEFSMVMFLLESKEQMLDKLYQNLVQLLHLIQLLIAITIQHYLLMLKLKPNLKEKDFGIAYFFLGAKTAQQKSAAKIQNARGKISYQSLFNFKILVEIVIAIYYISKCKIINYYSNQKYFQDIFNKKNEVLVSKDEIKDIQQNHHCYYKKKKGIQKSKTKYKIKQIEQQCCDIIKLLVQISKYYQMFQRISKWRMRNQLKLYFLLLSLFSTTLLAIILVITQNLVYKEVVNITQQISTKITENQVSHQFQLQMELFYQVINKNYRSLDKIAELFYFASHFTSLSISQPDQCPINQTLQYRLSNICYNVFNLNYGNQLNSSQLMGLEQYLKHQSLLQSCLPLLDPEQYIIGNWSIGYAKYFYFTAYQAIGFYSTFNIATRPFYKNHIAKAYTAEFIFSDVFFNFEGQYKVTISRNLTQNSLDGIVATQFEFNIIKKFFQENFLILNKDGLILIGNIQMYFKPNSTSLYFFNDSLTGFNNEDWISISNQINNNITNNNCSVNYQNYLCRYNKITQMDVIIFARFLKFSNLILIILKDIIKDQDLENQLIWIENQKDLQIQQLIMNQIIAAFGSSVVAILLVRYICRYMTNLERLANTHFQNKPVVDYQMYSFLKEINSLQESDSSNITLNLSDCYSKLILQLTERPFIKNEECKIFESFQFPQKKKVSTNKIFDLLDHLKNRKGLVKSSYKEYILKVLRNQQKFL